jgi:SAM-dependent methyltransferase
VFSQSAKNYDTIYSAIGKDYEAEASRLAELITLHSSARAETLLDVGCGTGGHIAYLQNQFEVEGLDLDEEMLQIAQRKLPGVKLHHGDMSDFDLGKKFDIVVCLFSSIGYVGTTAKLKLTIANLARHTNRGGLVFVEPWIYPEDFETGTPRAVFVDRPDLKLARMNVGQVQDGVSILDFHYLMATPAGIEQFTERHELALFRHEQYQEAFDSATLDVRHDEEGLDGRGLYIGIAGEDAESRAR